MNLSPLGGTAPTHVRTAVIQPADHTHDEPRPQSHVRKAVIRPANYTHDEAGVDARAKAGFRRTDHTNDLAAADQP